MKLKVLDRSNFKGIVGSTDHARGGSSSFGTDPSQTVGTSGLQNGLDARNYGAQQCMIGNGFVGDGGGVYDFNLVVDDLV